MDEIDYVKKAIKLGAEDYILKLSFTQDTLVELITRLKSTLRSGRRRRAGAVWMRVQSFNREEDLRTLLLGNQGPGDNEMLLDRSWDIPTIPLRPTRQAVFWWTTKRMNRPGSGTDSHIRKYGL